MNRLLACLVVASLASGCITSFQHAQDSFAPYDFGRPAQVYPNLKGEACEHRLFGFWKVSGDASASAAIATMTRGSAKIDNILGYQVEQKTGFWLLGFTSCTVVSGYPVIYKDSNPKWQLFEGNMVAGKLVAQPAVTPASAGPGPSVPSVPVAADKPAAGPVKTSKPAGLPPREADAAPTQEECDGMCGKFATLWKGSDAIRSTIRGQCVKKCLKPENKTYRNCIDGASKLDDISRCNAL
jgi:hypothetical protein